MIEKLSEDKSLRMGPKWHTAEKKIECLGAYPRDPAGAYKTQQTRKL